MALYFERGVTLISRNFRINGVREVANAFVMVPKTRFSK
jgi:hypothetical protein